MKLGRKSDETRKKLGQNSDKKLGRNSDETRIGRVSYKTIWTKQKNFYSDFRRRCVAFVVAEEALCMLGVKVRNMKMDFNTGGT